MKKTLLTVVAMFATATIALAESVELITTVEQLHGITNDLSGSFALGADIDLSNEAWTPIGSSSAPFTGSLDGGGYTIKGLRFDNTASGDAQGVRVGLFRCAKNATFVGVVLTDVDVNGYQYVGALAGEVQGETTVRDCCASGKVNSLYGYVGMLVGRVKDATGTVFENCGAEGEVVSSGQNAGGLVGDVSNATVSFDGCRTDVAVSGTGGNSKGGFVGCIETGGSASFLGCRTEGDVTAPSSQYVGGFIGNAARPVRCENCQTFGDVSGSGCTGGFVGNASGANAANSLYEDCSAWGDVAAGSGSQVGGFVGKASSSNDFTRCVSRALTVSGGGSVGGFVGSADGVNSQYDECEAHGCVKGTGQQVGGFAGRSNASGIRYARCSALGSASSSSSQVGGFVGYVGSSNDLWRCMSAGAATGSQYVGGFAGQLSGGNAAVRECFALGDATAAQNGDACAGGFAGDVYAETSLSDSYCLGTVKGRQKVGGFAGRNYNADTTVTRCYAAGVVDCAGTYAGAFVGCTNNNVYADCAALCDGDLHAGGTTTAATSAALSGVAEYGRDALVAAANFVTYRDTGLWTQHDGVTQPYLAWSSPDGGLMVYASVGGNASGEVDGAGVWCTPGDDATVTAVPDEGGFFVKWTGSTPYGSCTNQSTQIPMDNHRVASVVFGRYITTADELDAVRNDLAGSYGLGADIDLAGRDWTPIGNNSAKFTGAFNGFGHEIRNMVATNAPTSDYRGLFGYASGATIEGVSVSGAVKGGQCVGGIVGCAAGTALSDCSAAVNVASSSTHAGGLVGRVEGGSSFVRCSASGSVASAYGRVGGLIGACDSGDATVAVSDCRADGFVSGRGYVGGFVGYVNMPALISGCAARGDVKSTGDCFGGFIGYLGNAGATNDSCWASGAVWGTGRGDNCGSFIGTLFSGAVLTNCAVSACANGARRFCGSDAALAGAALTDDEVSQRSAGWPEFAKRSGSSALVRIADAAQLFAVTNDLAGCYLLTADIDLGGAAWTPVGNSSAGFTGEFYGNNHVISNFQVNSSSQCAGLFGNIAGGRVKGVHAFGTVTGASDQVGGFSGRISSRSLVEGCSFVGTVSSSSTKVGGFVGYVCDQPSVFECCAVGKARKTSGTGNGSVGGFVGQHGGGFVADSYANVAVSAGGAGHAGGFMGYGYGGSVSKSYCSGSVVSTATNNYVGAFVGNMYSGSVTNSYYDSDATPQLAAGKNGSAAGDYAGITPVAGADMKTAASFPALDFAEVWNIDEGNTMPYLIAFTVQKTGYELWLEGNGLPAETDPEAVEDGVPYLIRYVFDRPTGAFSPFTGISFNAGGKPVVSTLPLVNTDGVTVKVLSTTDLTDWSDAEEKLLTIDDNGMLIFDHESDPQRFYRLKAD